MPNLLQFNELVHFAGVAELADAQDLGSCGRKALQVQLLSPAPKNFTDEAVKFFTVYSYLIVYRPETTPLQIVSILHGRRDVEQLLRDRP